MARKILKELELKVSYKKGTDDKGNDIIKKQSFNNVNSELTPEDMYLFGEAVGEVINYSLTAIETEEEYTLVSEA